MINNSLKQKYDVEIIIPVTPPVIGAFYFGLEALDIPIKDSVIEKITRTYYKESSI